MGGDARIGDSGNSLEKAGIAADAWIDVFSGRPAPQWVLTGDETDELLSILAELDPVSPAPVLGDLGYRGMSARLWGGSEPDVLRAGNGVVVFEPLRERALRDPERRVERFLWDSARRHLPGEVTKPLESIVQVDG
jgi:hypothetical protein